LPLRLLIPTFNGPDILNSFLLSLSILLNLFDASFSHKQTIDFLFSAAHMIIYKQVEASGHLLLPPAKMVSEPFDVGFLKMWAVWALAGVGDQHAVFGVFDLAGINFIGSAVEFNGFPLHWFDFPMVILEFFEVLKLAL
jgi:hypothetical protein